MARQKIPKKIAETGCETKCFAIFRFADVPTREFADFVA